MYIPILKTRQVELWSVNDVKDCFSDTIIPLFEVMGDEYLKRYETDPETGEFLTKTVKYSTGRTITKRVEAPKTEADIITLENLSKRIDGKKMFVDFFRFHINEYRNKNVNTSALTLALKLAEDEYYVERIKSCFEFENIIPVISLKKHNCLSDEEVRELIGLAHNEGSVIALRVEISLLEEYKAIFEEDLKEDDYLLVDIRHNAIESKIIELEELQEYTIKAKKILLNSPKDESMYNTQYEENGLTEYIDNSAREQYTEYGFEGYGDYAGVADKLPTKNGGVNGSATALIYRYDVNQFEIFRNPNSALSVNGFVKVYQDVMAAEERLNQDGDCIAYEILHGAEKSVRSWKLWIRICITRYIHQVYKYM